MQVRFGKRTFSTGSMNLTSDPGGGERVQAGQNR